MVYKVALCLTVLVEQLVLHHYHIMPHKTHRIFAVYIHRTFFLIVLLKERKKKKEPKKKRRKKFIYNLYFFCLSVYNNKVVGEIKYKGDK